MKIIESCLACELPEYKIFCSNLPPRVLEAIERAKQTASYPPGAVLFVEGQAPTGFSIVCKGRVRLSISRSDGKTLILRIAEAGETLGLSAAISGQPYALTAATLDRSQVAFVQRDDLWRLMHEHPEVALRVAQHLGEHYQSACQEMRSWMLTRFAAERLARLILDWLVRSADVGQPDRVKVTLTHEEIAQIIGTSRETATRLFAGFRKKQWIDTKGSILVVRNRAAIESLAQRLWTPPNLGFICHSIGESGVS